MKNAEKLGSGQANISIHRRVVAVTGDFLSALIVEFINYRFLKNDKKPVWLKTDWIHAKLPYISRAGLDRKLNKLVKDGHIIKKKGEGRHYHKCWFSPSSDMREACTGKDMMDGAKVYFNPEVAKKNLEASVVYAAIINLLKTGDKLLLNYQKLADGSGLSLAKVRKAVAWLIKNKKIEAKKVFGNKIEVSVPPAHSHISPADLDAFLAGELPTESYPHAGQEDDKTEY